MVEGTGLSSTTKAVVHTGVEITTLTTCGDVLFMPSKSTVQKQSEHYAIQGIYWPDEEGKATRLRPIRSPKPSIDSDKQASKRVGKEIHGLSVVHKMLSNSSSWKVIEDRSTYQFPEHLIPK